MKIWAVFIYCRAAGYQSRWIDSQWATIEKARDREREIDRNFAAFDVPAHKSSVVELSVVNAAVVPPEDDPEEVI